MVDGTCPTEAKIFPIVSGEADNAEDDVKRHLQGCPRCRNRCDQLRSAVEALQSVTDELASTKRRPQPDREPTDPVAAGRDHIGRYRVVGKIASSGQADVYRVLHPRLQQDFVLKLGRNRLNADGPERDRLAAEARILAELEHPGLARVIDLDLYEGQPFVVMQYVRGRTLKQYAQDTHPAPREVALLIADVARALAPAHADGVIHQDIKPENILIDGQGRACVIDFGMALLRSGWADDTQDLNAISGTVPYMAPEQARGQSQQLGPAVDIFALGAVLYRLLVGHAPFEGRSTAEVLEKAGRCEFDMQPLQSGSVASKLGEICLRAMSEQPERRYASAEEMASELERFAKRPQWYRRCFLAAGLLGLAAVVLPKTLVPPPGSTAGATEFQHLVRAQRGDRVFEVDDELPLKKGDLVRVLGHVPPGMRASLFWFDSGGALSQLETKSSELPNGALKIVSRQDLPLDSETGTELVLLCARRGEPPTQDGMNRHVAELVRAGALPPLPPQVLVLMNRAAVEARSTQPDRGSRGYGAGQRSDLTQVEDRLERLRQSMAEQYEFFAAVAFPHR